MNQALAADCLPLEAGVRAFFEGRLGLDLSQIRLHTGPEAEAAAAAVRARAYTVGQHIVFGAGQYNPASSEGRRLLAHELAHVLKPGTPPVHRQSAETDEERRRPESAEPTQDAGPADAGRTADSEATDPGEADASSMAAGTTSDAGAAGEGASEVADSGSSTDVKPPANPDVKSLPSGHTPAPAGMAACPDAPPRNIVILGCSTTPAKAPPPKEEAKLPAPDAANFGDDSDRAKFATALAQCQAAREVKKEIEGRYRIAVATAKEQAAAEAKKETQESVAAAIEGIDPKEKRAISQAKAQAVRDAKKAAAKKIADAGAAVTREDVATVTAELAKKHRDRLEADYSATIEGAIKHRYGPGWKRTMQARLDKERKRITKQKTARPKVKKGEEPPPAKSEAEILAEIEAEMTQVRCDQKAWVLNELEGIARAWAVGRREEVDFQTISPKAMVQQKFKPSFEVAEADRVQIPESVRQGGPSATYAGIAPEVAAFLTELEAVQLAADPARRPPFTTMNRAGHGGGSWSGKGFSLDMYIPAARDSRGFWDPNAAIKFLLNLDATAKRFGARWRVLYNDFSVAQAVNKATGSQNVVFIGESTGNLNWHGPDPLILHFHLDLEIPKGAKAIPPAASGSGTSPTGGQP